jgi:regulator of RNase E activity RraA
VVADDDGVVIVQKEFAATILERLSSRAANQTDYLASVHRGDFSNDWVRALLEDGGCEIHD